MPATIEPDKIKSPIEEIFALSAKATKLSYQMGPERMKPACKFRKEIRALIPRVIEYLETELQIAEKIISRGKGPNDDYQKLVEEIALLQEKKNLSDRDYLKLSIAERKLADFSQRAETFNEKAAAAESVLQTKMANFENQFFNLIGQILSTDLIEEATEALTKFSLGRDITSIVQQLPLIQTKFGELRGPFKRELSGTANAKAMIQYLQAINL